MSTAVTCMSIACKSDNLKMVRYLIDINYNRGDDTYFDEFCVAVRSNSVDVVKFLINRIDRRKLYDPLIIACKYSYTRIAKILLKNIKNINERIQNISFK